MNRAARAAAGCLSGPKSRERAARTAGIGRYYSELRTWRGHCRAPGCQSRYGVARITLDTTAIRRMERQAQVECVQCGRVWFRVADDTPAAKGGFQSALYTLIVPTGDKRVVYKAHGGGLHVRGEDTVILTNATLGQLMDAAASWRERNGALVARLDRARARKAERDMAAVIVAREALAAMDARRAERRAEIAANEAAADAREKAGLA